MAHHQMTANTTMKRQCRTERVKTGVENHFPVASDFEVVVEAAALPVLRAVPEDFSVAAVSVRPVTLDAF